MCMGDLGDLRVLLFLPWLLCMFQGLTYLWVLNILIMIWGRGDDQSGGILLVVVYLLGVLILWARTCLVGV